MKNTVTAKCGTEEPTALKCLLLMKVNDKFVCCNEHICKGLVPRHVRNRTNDKNSNPKQEK